MAGLGDRLKKALTFGKTVTPTQEALKTTGTTVIAFEKTSARLATQEDFRRELQRKPPKIKTKTLEIFEWYVEQWYKIYDMFKTSQVAFGRAGNNAAYGRMFSAVDGIAKEIEIAIMDNRTILKRSQLLLDNEDEESKTKIVLEQQQLITNFVNAWLINAGYLFVEMTSDVCWFDKDVSTPETIVVQSNQPLQQDRAKVNEDLLKEPDVSE